MNKINFISAIFATSLLFVFSCSSMPHDFVSISEVDPSIKLDIRYFGENNFVGSRIDGYRAPKCILTKEAAEALSKVQADLSAMGKGLILFDCYRPERAVADFVRWAKDLSDMKKKGEFYPDVEKSVLFEEGYIASKSSHSRGSTVDLTIEGLDMGTPFDFFSPLSHTENDAVGMEALANRLLLKSVMTRHGFVNYDKEWWHYTLKDEPYTDKYFNFVVK